MCPWRVDVTAPPTLSLWKSAFPVARWWRIRLPLQGRLLTLGKKRSPGEGNGSPSSILAWRTTGPGGWGLLSWGHKGADATERLNNSNAEPVIEVRRRHCATPWESPHLSVLSQACPIWAPPPRFPPSRPSFWPLGPPRQALPSFCLQIRTPPPAA